METEGDKVNEDWEFLAPVSSALERVQESLSRIQEEEGSPNQIAASLIAEHACCDIVSAAFSDELEEYRDALEKVERRVSDMRSKEMNKLKRRLSTPYEVHRYMAMHCERADELKRKLLSSVQDPSFQFSFLGREVVQASTPQYVPRLSKRYLCISLSQEFGEQKGKELSEKIYRGSMKCNPSRSISVQRIPFKRGGNQRRKKSET